VALPCPLFRAKTSPMNCTAPIAPRSTALPVTRAAWQLMIVVMVEIAAPGLAAGVGGVSGTALPTGVRGRITLGSQPKRNSSISQSQLSGMTDLPAGPMVDRVGGHVELLGQSGDKFALAGGGGWQVSQAR